MTLLAVDRIQGTAVLKVAAGGHDWDRRSAGDRRREVRLERPDIREREFLPGPLVALPNLEPGDGGRHAARREVKVEDCRPNATQAGAVGTPKLLRGVTRCAGGRVERCTA